MTPRTNRPGTVFPHVLTRSGGPVSTVEDGGPQGGTREAGLGYEEAVPTPTRAPARWSAPAPRRPPARPGRASAEPTAALEWVLALEAEGVQDGTVARTPAERRRNWLYRAPEREVVTLYHLAAAEDPSLPAPWWVRPLVEGWLPSRAAALRFEDAVHALLSARPGWVYVPWVRDGEDGYWEFDPSEPPGGWPTTVVLTGWHPGWLDAIPPNTQPGLPGTTGSRTRRLPLRGLDDLATRLPEIERWRLGRLAARP